MSTQVLKDCKIWLGGYDISGSTNKLALSSSVAMENATVFGCSAVKNEPGLPSIGLAVEGFWEGGTDKIDEVLFNKVAVSDEVLSICGLTGDSGDIGYTCKVVQAEYSPSGEVGKLFAFKTSAQGQSNLVRSTIMENRTGVTASGTGTVRNLGQVDAEKKLYASLHVLSANAGGTLNVIVESDDADAFTSPTTRISFAQATAKGAQWATPVSGLISDTRFRVKWTVGGASPNFNFVVLLGIQ